MRDGGREGCPELPSWRGARLLLPPAAACGMRCTVSSRTRRVHAVGTRRLETGRARGCVEEDDVLMEEGEGVE